MKLIKFCLIISTAVFFIYLLSGLIFSQTNSNFYTNNFEEFEEENNNQETNASIPFIIEFNEETNNQDIKILVPETIESNEFSDRIDVETTDVEPVIHIETNELPSETQLETSIDTPKNLLKNDKQIFKELNYLDYVWKSALCPGFGQYSLKRIPKAIFLYSSFACSGTLGLIYHFKAEDTYQVYISKKDTKEVTQLYDDYLLQNQIANVFFYITLGIWVYNILDIVMDVRWMNMNSKDSQKKNKEVTINFNSKEIHFDVYKKMF